MNEPLLKLTPGCFEDILVSGGYKDNRCKEISFNSNLRDSVWILFKDNSQLGVSYGKESLFMVRLMQGNKVKRRLIPEGRPTYDEHFCDVLSFATGSNVVLKGEEFDDWERFSHKSLSKMLSYISHNFKLKSIEPTFGLQNWLNLDFYKDSRFFPSEISLGFRFSTDSPPIAIYQKADKAIFYSP